MLIEAKLLAALAGRHLATRRRADGAPSGNRIGRRLGVSLDFADHRAYADGDDLRFMDWLILARHDQPFVRRYHEEQALPVHILLDLSASMDQGRPNKFQRARAAAAGLGFVALAGGAVLSVRPFSDRPLPPLGPLRGRSRYHLLLDYLSRLDSGGRSDFRTAAASVATPGRSGLCIVISDFLFPAGLEEGLARLDHARHSIFLLRLVAPHEEDPELGGDLTLVDAESGEQLGWSFTPSVLQAYRRQLAVFEQKLEAAGRRRSAGVASVRTDLSLKELFLVELPSRGLLR
jgi:uncharacterized protein (DUF58 family)